jgi:uncharacterized protein (TIGR02453 family)
MKKTTPTFPSEGLKFLRSLKRHNNREWFQARKSLYEQVVKAPMEELVAALAEEFQVFAPEIIATPRKSLYRIYRDTRFSKDKSPYKTHVAASFPRKGLERHQGAGLYLHIAPTEVLVGGGVYMPASEDLNAIRNHIASNFREFRAIVESKGFRKLFNRVSGEQLSRVPRGFVTDHPAAEYLKYKQYLAARNFEPEMATTGEFYKAIVETFRGMMPFIRFLNAPIVSAQNARVRHDTLLGLND